MPSCKRRIPPEQIPSDESADHVRLRCSARDVTGMTDLPSTDDVLRPLADCLRIAIERARIGRSFRGLVVLTSVDDDTTQLMTELRRKVGDAGIQLLDLSDPPHRAPTVALASRLHEFLAVLAETTPSDAPGGSPLVTDGGIDPLLRQSEMATYLPELFERVGLAARQAGRPIVILMNDLDALDDGSLQSWLMAMHHIARRALPIVMVAVGSQRLPRRLGNMTPNSERLFQFVDLRKPDTA
jgi:hypothetical protein